MSTNRDLWRQINWQATPKYGNGVSSIRSGQSQSQQMASGAIQVVGDAYIPGLGTAVSTAGNAVDSALENENGVYNDKTHGQLNDFINPVAHATGEIRGIKELFHGNFKKAAGNFFGWQNSDQDDLRAALEKDRLDKRIADNQSFYGAPDPSTLTGRPYANGTNAATATKPVVIEGMEPVFSAPGADGMRKLLQFEPNGPTHAQGGIPTVVPEGAAIVTKKDGMSTEALRAFLHGHITGDHSKLERLIAKLPDDDQNPHDADDQTPKMGNGVASVRAGSGPGPKPGTVPQVPFDLAALLSQQGMPHAGLSNPAPEFVPNGALTHAPNVPNTARAGYNLTDVNTQARSTPSNDDLAAGLLDADAFKQYQASQRITDLQAVGGAVPEQGAAVSTTRGVGDMLRDGMGNMGGASGMKSGIGGIAQGLAMNAPALFNLGKGLLDTPVKVTRRHVNPAMLVAPDLTANARNQNRSGLDAGLASAVDLSGGNAANVRANEGQQWQEYLRRGEGIEGQQASARYDAYKSNVEAQNGAQATNLQLDNRYDEQDLAAQAAKTKFLQQGLQDLSNVASANQKNEQQRIFGEKSIGALNAMNPNFEMVKGEDGNYSMQPKNMSTKDPNWRTPVQEILHPTTPTSTGTMPATAGVLPGAASNATPTALPTSTNNFATEFLKQVGTASGSAFAPSKAQIHKAAASVARHKMEVSHNGVVVKHAKR